MKSFVAAAVLALPLCVSGTPISIYSGFRVLIRCRDNYYIACPRNCVEFNWGTYCQLGQSAVLSYPETLFDSRNDPSEFAMYLINFGTNQTIPPQTILINAQGTVSWKIWANAKLPPVLIRILLTPLFLLGIRLFGSI